MTTTGQIERDVPPGRAPPAIPAADRLAAALDAARTAAPGRLSAALRADPLRAELRAALARLGPDHVLRIMHGLALPDLPAAGDALAGLLRGGPSGEGRALRARLEALHRRALFDRIFHPDRVAALRRACRDLKHDTNKEPDRCA